MSQRQNQSTCQGGNNGIWRRKSALSLAAATVMMGIASAASAQAISWIGPTGVSAAFETGTNWDGGSVPGATNIAMIDNGGIANISTYNWTVSGEILAMQIGSEAGTSGSVVQDGGDVKLSQTLVLGNSANTAPTAAGVGSYTMNGGTLTAADYPIGSKGMGTFTLNNGAVISTGHMRLGDDRGSSGILNMHGGTLTIPGFMLVGHFNPDAPTSVVTGTFNIDGGVVTIGNFNIGQHLYTRGTVNQSGGQITSTSHTIVAELSRGDASAPTRYNLSGGLLKVINTNNLYAGSSGGLGEVIISGTGNAQVDGHLWMAGGDTAEGTLNISGGTLALGLNKTGGGYIAAGNGGKATVIISGGDVSADYFELGRNFNATSQGQGTMTGGNLTLRGGMSVGRSSAQNNFFNISGGTVAIQGADGLNVARRAYDPGTGTVATNYSKGVLSVSGTANIAVTGPLTNSLGWTRLGNATLGTETVDLPGGAGTIDISGGTVTAASFINGGAANAGTYNNGGASANYVQSGGAVSVGPVTGNGNMTVSGGTMTVGSIQQSAISISGNGLVAVAPNGTPTGTSVVKSLSISGSGELDLNNNSAIIDYTGPVGTLVDDVRQHLAAGRLTTSMAGTPAGTTLGYGDNAVLGVGTFGGQAVDASSMLIKFTYAGDANLDGQVDITDLGILATAWQTSGPWTSGDADYSGFVDITDLGALATNWQAGVGAPLGPSLSEALAQVGLGGVSIPEPASTTVLSFGAAALLRRRRNASL